MPKSKRVAGATRPMPSGDATAAASPARRLAIFLGRYDPAVAQVARAARRRLRRRWPGAVELVYDNYNALVIGFGPTERASDAVFSLAVYPRWVNFFWLRGAALPDPEGVLAGAGKQVRHLALGSAADLDRPAVRALIDLALTRARIEIDPARRGRLVIKSVAARRRPRRAG